MERQLLSVFLGIAITFIHTGEARESAGKMRRILLRGVESSQELGILERLAHRIRLFTEGKHTPPSGES